MKSAKLTAMSVLMTILSEKRRKFTEESHKKRFTFLAFHEKFSFAPPSFSHWIREVLFNLRLEKIRYTIRGSEKIFSEVWRSFQTFFDKPSSQVQED